MTQGQTDDAPAQQTPPRNFRSRRLRILGLDSDDFVRAFFGGNATLAIVVLVLIMAFLFRESAGFFGSYAKEMESYRRSGLELVDCMRTQLGDYNALTRKVSTLEAHKIAALMKGGATLEEARLRTARLRELATQMRTNARSQTKLVDGLTKYAVALRDEYKTMLIRQENRDNLRDEAARAERRGNAGTAASLRADADALVCPDINLPARRAHIIEAVPEFAVSNARLREDLARLLDGLVSVEVLDEDETMDIREQATGFIEASFVTEQRLREWNADEPVPMTARLTSFLFGRRWITNSFFQDWYGVLPLLSGSLIISFIALMIAVPFGLAGAIHVNQFAGRREQTFIKPYIEFISAIPSVVIGFFGVIVWGEFVREASGWDALSWIPGFPISERLNAFTAGCLLALMAVPTIFTLAEDALNNVPNAFKEASFAVGATRLQTTIRVVIPTALSGMVSAVLLGFGRVIGETMVVLLCAGNRIDMPDMSEGLAAFFQPMHTMTGLVAQEMGEVVPGGIHYCALFLVGTLLFFISLLINYLAQKVMRRYSIAERS